MNCKFGAIIDIEEIEDLLCDDNITSLDRLFVLTLRLFSQINNRYENTESVSMPSKCWAKTLNISEGWALKVRDKMENLGYIKRSRHIGVEVTNEISPVLTKGDKINLLPIQINFSLLKDILGAVDIKYFDKILWLYCYAKGYEERYINRRGTFVFETAYSQLCSIFKCSKSYMCKSVKRLSMNGYAIVRIQKERKSISFPIKSSVEISVLMPKVTVINSKGNFLTDSL